MKRGGESSHRSSSSKRKVSYSLRDFYVILVPGIPKIPRPLQLLCSQTGPLSSPSIPHRFRPSNLLNTSTLSTKDTRKRIRSIVQVFIEILQFKFISTFLFEKIAKKSHVLDHISLNSSRISKVKVAEVSTHQGETRPTKIPKIERVLQKL